MSYYDIKITGKDVKRFIRNLHKMHINFYKMKYIKNSVIIKVNEMDYEKIKGIKTIYEIEIIKYYGIAKFKNYLKINSVFLIILSVGFIFFLGLTNIIFSVEVNYNDKELRELVLKELEKEGISKYKFVVSFDKKERIKERILERLNDRIEWLEINRIGTKYSIELEERKKLDNDNDNTPRNIIAKKNGIITKIVSDHGEIIGKIDQYVKKGDILISGTIHNKEEVVDNIKADGEVFAETWYTVTVELPYHYHEETKTKNSTIKLKINWFNKELNLFRLKNYKNSINSTIYSIKNFLLPISISLEKEEEIIINDQIYSYENAIQSASDIARKKLINDLGTNAQIKFEKKLKYDEINSKIVVVMFYKVIENITDYQNIDLTNEIIDGS